MKKLLALLMVTALMLPLAACKQPDPDAVQDAGSAALAADVSTTRDPTDPGAEDGAGDPYPTDDELWDPLAAVELTTPDVDGDAADADAEPTPMPVVELMNYTYELCENDELLVSFKYPSHWTNIAGQNTICYVEPVEPGVVGARLAITVKSAGKVVVTEWLGMDKLTGFSKVIKADVEKFKMKKKGRQKINKNTAFNFIYTAVKDETPIKGFCALVYNPKTNMFTVLHWYTPSDRYADFEPIRKTIIKSMKC